MDSFRSSDLTAPYYLVTAAAATVAGVLYALWCLPRLKSSIQELPTPGGAEWLWGHEKIVATHEPGRIFRQWIKELGLAFRIKAALQAPDILVLSDPLAIQHILQKRIYDYHHSAVVRPRVARLLGKGLGWVEGESEHKKMRRLVGPSLSAENVKAMSAGLTEAVAKVISDLVHAVEDESGVNVMNVLDWTGKATLNVIGRVAFLHDFEGGNSLEARNILQARRQGVSVVTRYAGFLTLMLLRRFPVLNRLPLPVIQGQELVKNTIQSGVARELVRRDAGVSDAASNEQQKDLLSRLLAAAASDSISQQELYEHISTFIISGQETTNQTLGFTIWELARHCEAQAKLREELRSLSREPTYEDFQGRLPYLDAVLRESIRMYPGLPYMERVAMKPDIIPLREPIRTKEKVIQEVAVQKGQTVLIPIISIHRLDSVWTDPDTFRPERWLGMLPPQEKLVSGWSNTLGFSDGPRNCIGFRLAIFQYKVILSALVTRFYFEDTHKQMSLKIASSLQPLIKGEEEAGPQVPIIMKLI